MQPKAVHIAAETAVPVRLAPKPEVLAEITDDYETDSSHWWLLVVETFCGNSLSFELLMLEGVRNALFFSAGPLRMREHVQL